MPTNPLTANTKSANTNSNRRQATCRGTLLATVILIAFGTNKSHAAQVTFAQFQQNTAGSPFVFTNIAGTSTFVANDVPVNFQYLVTNDYGPANQNIAAHLSLYAVVDSAAFTAGILIDQPLKEIQISITADTPVNGNDLLLMVALDSNLLSTGHLTGMVGGHIALESGDTDLPVANYFAYSSSFVSFVSGDPRNYALSFSSVNPNFSLHANGFLNSFLASGTGTFAATMVPEPTTGGLALAGAGLIARKFRRRPRTTEAGVA